MKKTGYKELIYKKKCTRREQPSWQNWSTKEKLMSIRHKMLPCYRNGSNQSSIDKNQ